jgi:hypothetical protein
LPAQSEIESVDQVLAPQTSDDARRCTAVFALLVLAVIALMSCSPSANDEAQQDPLRALSPGGVAAGDAFFAPPNTLLSIQLNVGLCTDRPLTVDRLVPHVILRQNLRLVHWAIDNRSTFTPHQAVRGVLNRLGDFTSRQITQTCPTTDDRFAPVSHIGVELMRTSAEPAAVMGFELRYRSGGQRISLPLYTPLALCASHLPSCDSVH